MSIAMHTGPAGSVEQVKSDVHEIDCVENPDGKEVIEEAAPPTLTPEQEKKLWRKIDMRILPILTLMYLCSFMDRGAVRPHMPYLIVAN